MFSVYLSVHRVPMVLSLALSLTLFWCGDTPGPVRGSVTGLVPGPVTGPIPCECPVWGKRVPKPGQRYPQTRQAVPLPPPRTGRGVVTTPRAPRFSRLRRRTLLCREQLKLTNLQDKHPQSKFHSPSIELNPDYCHIQGVTLWKNHEGYEGRS